jgi:hypothetical protein
MKNAFVLLLTAISWVAAMPASAGGYTAPPPQGYNTAPVDSQEYKRMQLETFSSPAELWARQKLLKHSIDDQSAKLIRVETAQKKYQTNGDGRMVELAKNEADKIRASIRELNAEWQMIREIREKNSW